MIWRKKITFSSPSRKKKKSSLSRFKSIFHYAQLLTFPPTGSAATVFVRIVIDKMSLLIEKWPHFLTS